VSSSMPSDAHSVLPCRMTRPRRSAAEILQAARQMLDVARIGERDYHSGLVDRQTSGMYQAFTSGRSVTFVLQNLSSAVEGWEDWYSEEQARMKADPVSRWAVEVRNSIEKQGTAGPGRRAYFGGPNGINPLLEALTSAAPRGTIGIFLMDKLGRCGWVVEAPDGTQFEVYYGAPQGVTLMTLYLEDAPGGRSVDSAITEYLDGLEALLSRAQQRFL